MIVLLAASLLSGPVPEPAPAEPEPLVIISVAPDPDPDFVPPPVEPASAAKPRPGKRRSNDLVTLERQMLAALRQAEEAIARTCATMLAAERAAGETTPHPTCSR